MTFKFASNTRQAFYDVAKRRAVEAEMLLTVPHKPCDGAVTCGLLAAECALKATLLHGHTANTPDDLPETIRKAAFEGKSGHVIAILWGHQSATMKSSTTPALNDALDQLHQMDRYKVRYGVTRPQKPDARPYIDACKVIVTWMKAQIA